jgi:uncharacterized protein (DUF2344 family)
LAASLRCSAVWWLGGVARKLPSRLDSFRLIQRPVRPKDAPAFFVFR